MDPITWLDTFFSLCPTCKVDFITTHVSKKKKEKRKKGIEGNKKIKKNR